MRASISQIKLFKACRRAYYFKYVEKLESTERADALVTGTNYHSIVEDINNNGDDAEIPHTKEGAMATAYRKYIYPNFKVRAAEEWFEYNLTARHTLIGRVDGLSEDGRLVEHKTTGMEITEAYEYNLLWDEQLLAYMLATGTRKVYYTICRKPTIRQKKDESDDEFFERMVAWYDTDTESKIRLLKLERSDEEVDAFAEDLAKILDEMETATNLYKNCGWCNVWGRRCEYSGICLNYNPEETYIGFRKR